MAITAEDTVIISINPELNESKLRAELKKIQTEHTRLSASLAKQQQALNRGKTENIALIQQTRSKLAKNTAEMSKQQRIINNLNTLQKANVKHIKEEAGKVREIVTAESRRNNAIKKAQQATIANSRQTLSIEKQITKEKNKQSRTASSKRTASTGTTNGREGFYDTMFEGAGTTFGHKLATTAQYATAGAAVYALATTFTTATRAIIEFDTATRTLSAVLKISLTDARDLGQEFNDLGKSFGGTLTDIYGVANALGRAGVATGDLVEGTEIVIKMAKLTGDTFDQATSALVSYAQVFGTGADGKLLYTMEELGDKLANIANASRMSTQDIGIFSNYALAAAKSVGLSLDAVSGLAIAFSNSGVNASTAGTQVRRFTSLLLDDGKAATNFFNTLGITQKNFIHEMKKGTQESNAMMASFAADLKSLSDGEFLDLMQGMDLLATNSLNLIRNNSDEFIKAMSNSYSGVKGELKEVSTIIDGTRGSWERFVNTLQDTAIDVAETGNAINLITGALTTMAEWTGSLFSSEEEQRVVTLRREIRGFQLQLDTFNLTAEQISRKEGLILVAAEEISKIKDASTLERKRRKLDSSRLEELRVIKVLNTAILNDDKVAITHYQKKLKLIQETVKQLATIDAKRVDAGAGKGTTPKFVAPTVDPQVLLSSIKALDAIGASTDTTYRTLQTTISNFGDTTSGKISKMLSKVTESSTISKNITDNMIVSQSNLFGLLANGGDKLSSNLSIRTEQINVIKAILPLLEEVNKNNNIELQASKLINDSQFNKIVNSEKLAKLEDRLQSGRLTKAEELENQLILEEKLLASAIKLYGPDSPEAKAQRAKVTQAEISKKEYAPIADMIAGEIKSILVAGIQDALDGPFNFKALKKKFEDMTLALAENIGQKLFMSGDPTSMVIGATLMASEQIIGAGQGDDYVGPLERAEEEFDVFMEGLNAASEALTRFGNVGSDINQQITKIEGEITKYSQAGGYNVTGYSSGMSRRYRATYDGQTFRSGERAGVTAQIEAYKKEQLRLLRAELETIVLDSLGNALDIAELSIVQLQELTAGIDISRMEDFTAQLETLALEAKLGGEGFEDTAAGIQNAEDAARILKDTEYTRYRDMEEVIDTLVELRDEEVQSIEDTADALEKTLDVIRGIIDKLRDIDVSPEEDLRAFNDRMFDLLAMDMGADPGAFAEALDKTIAATDVFFDTKNFITGLEQEYGRLIAANQFEALEEMTLTEIDYLRMIAENTATSSVIVVDPTGVTTVDTGFASGGYTGNISTSDVAGVVHGQEYVVNASTTKDLGLNSGNGGVFKAMLSELHTMNSELSMLKQMQIKVTADTKRQLDTQRATLDELITLNEET